VQVMAKDPGPKSKDKEQSDQVAQTDDEEEESDEVVSPFHPTCPRCGWHNTRLSHTKGMLDSLLRTFSIRAYRCRSCANRFHTFRRGSAV